MTTTKSRFATMLLMSGYLFSIAAVPALQAQKKKPTKKGTTKGMKYAHRLPSHFRQIGISEDQKAKVYKIQDKYRSKIDALKKELAELQEKQMGECEDLLSTRQKSALNKFCNKKKPTTKTKTTTKKTGTTKKKK